MGSETAVVKNCGNCIEAFGGVGSGFVVMLDDVLDFGVGLLLVDEGVVVRLAELGDRVWE